MNEIEVKQRLITLIKEKRTKIVVERQCNEADIKGAIKIILDNPSVSGLRLKRVQMSLSMFDTNNEEQFLTTDDPEYNKVGRELLLKLFCKEGTE